MAYIDTENLPLHMPVPGTREPAQIALLNENCVTLSNHDHTTGKGLAIGRLRSGTEANRPAASTPGNVYFATDTGRFFVDTGTAWVEFITSGGQATVTGWTLVDPIIRDTLQFGPEGGAGVDASLSRVAALALQTDSKFGVGVTPDPQWGPNLRIVQFGSAGALVGYSGTEAEEVQFTGNSVGRADNKQYAILPNSPANRLRLSQGALIFESAPAVAAGLEQTFTTRLSSGITGTLTIASAPGAQGIDLQQQGTDINGVPSIMIRRGVPTSQHQTIRFQNGASLGDFDIGRRAGSDDLRFMFWNGASLTDRFVLSPSGSITLSTDSPQTALTFNSNPGIIAGGGSIIIRPPTGFFVHMGASGAGVAPELDNATALGWPNVRWTVVYAVNGTIQTSHVSMKEDFAPLDPAACAAAVLETDWLSFRFKAPAFVPPEFPEGEPDREQKLADAQARHDEMTEQTAAGRAQKGYVLGSGDHQTSDLFGQADRRSASPSSDLAVVACALQSALQRIAALEAASGQPATSA